MTAPRNLLLVSLVSSLLAGCGSKPSEPTAAQPQEPAQVEVATAAGAAVSAMPLESVALPASSSTPQEIVLAFLQGMRDGNGQITGALLTKKAQEETVKHDWPVQPPGAPSATYELGTVSHPNPSVAHVPCVWSEADGEGGQVKFEVVWALSRETEGWRVAGFATEIVPGRPAFYFNFEDIASLRAVQGEAEAALTQAMEAESAPAKVAERPQANSLR